ncbi:uncharacterized protein B0I36DRAFT_360500 [Microdochium trichocladiopsis]|uniref:Uncharacterized protein n=1 Tax=Microdochium trichocladiopsis TaxID=1682393 RepID=A0A9P9BWG7_9PEZI|nr:uncharacterized protein B0I36DRAFT_360500 [Microdochium trichocladiopsis]KAH7035056.1 hypothetical protein B0I36DRAFT_360500 [Microdochium trichocladiopsis]
MEPLDPATRQAFRAALEEVLRPRDEVLDYQKAHEEILAQSYGEDILKHPLALLPPGLEVARTEGTTPSRLEELIDANIRLNKELRQLQEASRLAPDISAEDKNAHKSAQSTPGNVQDSQVIDLQLQVNALEEKRTRLNIFLNALDRLERLPAAEPGFMHPAAMFQDCSPLPDLPKELMEGFTRDTSAPQHEIETMMRGLHKAVLRNKLLAQREKRNLDAMRAESNIDPAGLPADVQLHALGAVKDHLIGWIESQLMQAGDDEDEDVNGNLEDGSGSAPATRTKNHGDDVDLDTKLANIQNQYSKHISLRKDISTLLAEADHISHDLERFRGMRIADDAPATADTPASNSAAGSALSTLNPPATLMLTPYLEKLQQTSREQKAMVQEKSYINSSFAKQQQHMSQTIQDLVEESRLLATYPSAAPPSSSASLNGSRRSSKNRSLGEATRRSAAGTRANVASQVEPFVYSADSAKIATLEVVVENIEVGQMAVDEARAQLDVVRRFLNKSDQHDEPVGDDSRSPHKQAATAAASGHRRRNTEGKIMVEDHHEKSIWSKLDGNLGLIND